MILIIECCQTQKWLFGVQMASAGCNCRLVQFCLQGMEGLKWEPIFTGEVGYSSKLLSYNVI